MARPLKNIDKKIFENLCGLQCTKLEICSAFDVSDKTLENWCKREYKKGFSEVFRQKREVGKISLRRSQFKLAEKSAAMGIWLGKQYLGQKDILETIEDEKIKDDGFLKALEGSAAEDWNTDDGEDQNK